MRDEPGPAYLTYVLDKQMELIVFALICKLHSYLHI